ncbi:MAG: membrane protein insertase YidC [Planctomycetes bacterium]|nr:membrane protein insertase YidC [Planctomycetota bacterium]
MQQKNLMAFLVVAMLVMLGWIQLQQILWPGKPRQPDDKKDPIAKQDKDRDKKVKDQGKAKDKKKEIAKPAPPVADWDRLGPEARNSVLAASSITSAFGGSPFGIPAFVGRIQQTQRHVLGGAGFFLEAVISSRGAGVERLTLNNFEAADRLGRPINKPLDLIVEDPFFPSFLLYHYPMVEKQDPAKFFPSLTLGQRVWDFKGRSDNEGVQELRFSTSVPPPYAHLVITKVYRLSARDYHIGLDIEISDQGTGGKDAPAFRYQLAGAHGVPIEGEWYATTYRNAFIGVVDGRGTVTRTVDEARTIAIQEGGDAVPDPLRGLDEGRFIQYAGVGDQYFGSMIVVDDKQALLDEGGVDKTSIIAWARPTLESSQTRAVFQEHDGDTLVAAERDGIRTFQLLPGVREQLKKQEFKKGEVVVIQFYRLDPLRRVATSIRRGKEPHLFANDIMVRVNSDAIELRPGQKVVHRYMLYNGPLKVALLGQMGAKSPSDELIKRYRDTLHLRTLTDYGRFGVWTDLLIYCTRAMHWLLHILHLLVGSYGLSIILLTVVVRGLMFPISRKQAIMGIKMQELAPEMKKLQEKHKSDPRARQEAMMELYRKHNVHPLGSCLPLLLQLPIFMGLYYALQESVFFRQASFLWIDNLSAPDSMIWWGEGIPWISDPDNMGSLLYLGPYFNLLPVLAVVFMVAQQKMMTPPPTDEQQAMQFKMMRYMMIFVGVMFYKVAAGLCIYFIASSAWGLAERKLLPKKQTAPTTPEAAAPKPPLRKTKPGKKEPRKEDGAVQKVKDWWSEMLKQAKKK